MDVGSIFEPSKMHVVHSSLDTDLGLNKSQLLNKVHLYPLKSHVIQYYRILADWDEVFHPFVFDYNWKISYISSERFELFTHLNVLGT